jgi:hypothetical protein
MANEEKSAATVADLRGRLVAGLALSDFAAAVFAARRPLRFIPLRLHSLNCRIDHFRTRPISNEWYLLSSEWPNICRHEPAVDPAKLTGHYRIQTGHCILMACAACSR